MPCIAAVASIPAVTARAGLAAGVVGAGPPFACVAVLVRATALACATAVGGPCVATVSFGAQAALTAAACIAIDPGGTPGACEVFRGAAVAAGAAVDDQGQARRGVDLGGTGGEEQSPEAKAGEPR